MSDAVSSNACMFAQWALSPTWTIITWAARCDAIQQIIPKPKALLQSSIILVLRALHMFKLNFGVSICTARRIAQTHQLRWQKVLQVVIFPAGGDRIPLLHEWVHSLTEREVLSKQTNIGLGTKDAHRQSWNQHQLRYKQAQIVTHTQFQWCK